MNRFKHIKRGTTYLGLGAATLQTSKPLDDYSLVYVYRDEKDNKLWVRDHDEFFDGRFEKIENNPKWKPISTAPRDGTTIQLLNYNEMMPQLYTAWFATLEKTETPEGVIEYEGDEWVLNDDERTLASGDETDSWYWSPLDIEI